MSEMSEVQGCFFCGLIAAHRGLQDLPEGPEPDRVVADHGRLISTPTVSPIRAGHLLILPAAHASSLAAWCRSDRENEGHLRRVRRAWIAKFRANGADGGIVFEHGVGDRHDVRCGTDHAHLHCVPLWTREEADALRSHIEGVVDALAHSANHASTEYGWMEMDSRDWTASWRISSRLPSQFLRNVVRAGLSSDAAADWRELGNWTEYWETSALVFEGG